MMKCFPVPSAKGMSSRRYSPRHALVGLDVVQRGDERVDIFVGVVERQRRTHRGLEPEPAQVGCAQWWPERTAMPSRSRPRPLFGRGTPSITNESTPAFSGAVPMMLSPGTSAEPRWRTPAARARSG